jgi:hypothetical protein
MDSTTVDPAVYVRALQELAIRRSQESTYTTPLLRSADRKLFFQDFYRKLYTPERKQYYRNERNRFPQVDVQYRQLCGRIVSYEDFWQRYDYRCDLVRIQNELQHEVGHLLQVPLKVESVEGVLSNHQQESSVGTALSSQRTVQNLMDVPHCESQKTSSHPLSPSTDSSLSDSHKENSTSQKSSKIVRVACTMEERSHSSFDRVITESAIRQRAKNEATSVGLSLPECLSSIGIEDELVHQDMTKNVDDRKIAIEKKIRKRVINVPSTRSHCTESIEALVLGNSSIQNNNGLLPKGTFPISRDGVDDDETDKADSLRIDNLTLHDPVLDDKRKDLIQGMPCKPILNEFVNTMNSEVEQNGTKSPNTSAKTKVVYGMHNETSSSVSGVTVGTLAHCQHRKNVYWDDDNDEDYANGPETKEKQGCECTWACVTM